MKVTINVADLDETCAALAYASGRMMGSGHTNVGVALFAILEQIREQQNKEINITDAGYSA